MTLLSRYLKTVLRVVAVTLWAVAAAFWELMREPPTGLAVPVVVGAILLLFAIRRNDNGYRSSRRALGLRRMIASLRQPIPNTIITITIVAILAFPLTFFFTIPCRLGRNFLAMDLPSTKSNRPIDSHQPWTRAILEANHRSAENREMTRSATVKSSLNC
jgi:hypothetical protein